jgi:hypothetical protein
MRRLTGIFMALALALAGCASPGPQSLPEPLSPLPYRITLEFTSDISDPYYVLSGPRGKGSGLTNGDSPLSFTHATQTSTSLSRRRLSRHSAWE